MVLTASLSDRVSYQSEDCPPPPLIRNLTGEGGNILLLFRDKIVPTVTDRKASVTQTREVSRRQSFREESDDLDLTGSPLRCDFDLDEKFNTSDVTLVSEVSPSCPTYLPLTVREARQLLSGYNVGQERSKKPVWVMCDGQDKTKTLYLGSDVRESGMRLSQVTWSGPDCPKDCSQKMQTLKKLHQSQIEDDNRQQVTQCNGRYHLSGDDESGSSVQVFSSWSRAGAVLESPPLEATTHLEVHLVPGDDKTATGQMWEQLQMLRGCVQGLSNEGVTWRSRRSPLPLLDQVKELMETVRTAGPCSGGTTIAQMEATVCLNDKTDDSFEGFTLETRQEVDFTDQLWLVLSRAQSYLELTEAFSAVFQAIIQDEIRPFIYARANNLRVVRIVQGLLRGVDTLPDLSGSVPLELLVEIGMEKLQRDYSHTLLAGELAAKETVAHFLDRGCDVGDNRGAKQMDRAVKQLTQLHLVVELASLVQTYLCLPPDALRNLVQTALVELRDAEDDRTDFRFPIKTCHLKEQLEKVGPNNWQVRLSSETPSSSVLTVASFQTERPAVLRQEAKLETEESHDQMYYTTTLNTITTL